MAKHWKCARCGVQNEEGTLNCSGCRMIRGGVVVPSTTPPSAKAPSVESPSWPAPPAQWFLEDRPEIDPDAPSYWESPSTDGPSADRPPWLRMLRHAVVVVTIIGFLGGLIGVGRSATGEISRGGAIEWSELRIGDCFDAKGPRPDGDLTARPCPDEHKYEVIQATSMPDGAYPTDEEFLAYFDVGCTPSFLTYVGRDYQQSALEIDWTVSDKASWGEGDRSVMCAVYDPKFPRLIGSLKGSEH